MAYARAGQVEGQRARKTRSMNKVSSESEPGGLVTGERATCTSSNPDFWFIGAQRTRRFRVESRTGAVAVVSRWLYVAGLSHRRRSPVWLGAVSCSRSSNRTGGSPASGSRKRLTFSPTEDRWPAQVNRPSRTQRREIPPEIAGLPATVLCVSYTATDAASSWRVDRLPGRLGRLVPDRSSLPTRSSSG